jgi:4-hydroxy-tetrahydrodipicolinate synthase
MTRLSGCGTAIVTPFTDDGAVDWSALRALVEWQVAEGIDFVAACGTTGEAQTLTDEERARVVSATRDAVAGRVPVMAGATSNDTRRAVEEVRRMCDAGADVILTASPYYNRPTQDGLRRHFEAVADASPRPVVLYNVPGRAGVNLLPATAVAVAAHDNVIGIKEAAGDMHQALELLRLRPDGFRVFSGDDWMALPLCACGGDGLISVASNVMPRELTELVRLARAGDLAQARALQWKLQPLLDANFIESNPIPVKAALAAMGRIRNVLRLPLVPAQPATVARLRLELARLNVRLEP